MNFKRFQLNKLILGTAQFGANYGITNKSKKKISKQEKNKILSFCKDIGLNHLDSAEGYNFKFSPKKKQFWKIDTKISTNEKFILKKKYKNFSLDTIYIRDPENIFSKNGRITYDYLAKQKKLKKIKKIGISVYEIKNLKKIIKYYKIDVVQLPYNILDRRFEKIFNYLKKNNIKIYARSIFLQGLLVTGKNIFSSHKAIKKFNKFVFEKKEKKIEICLDFVRKSPYIDKYVVGIHNLNHLKQIIYSNIFKNIHYPKSLISLDKKLIDPRVWKT